MRKVLIADDEKTIRTGISLLVSRTGRYEIAAVCSNGREAYEKTLKLEPDIVITDIRMPEMDGLTYIAECSTLSRIPKFIILSGFQEFEYLREAHLLDVVDYILKPVNHSELIELLDRVSEKIEMEDGDRQLQLSQYGILSIQQHERSRNQINLLKVKLDLDLSNLRVTIISLKNGFSMDNQVLSAAVDTVKAGFRESILKPEITFLYENQIVSIFSDCGIDSSDIAVKLNGIARELEMKYSLQSRIGMGGRVPDDNSTKISYLQALHSIIGGIYDPGRSVYLYKPEWLVSGSREDYFKVDLNKTALALKTGNSELGFETLNNLFSRMEMEHPDPGTILDFCDRLHPVLMNRFNNCAIDFSFDDLIGEEVRKFILENHPCLEDLRVLIEGILSRGFNFLKSMGSGKTAHFIDDILDYLNNHLAEEIYLDKICEKFLVNKSYLCSIFKEKTGKTFNNYLTGMRIEKSKLLLSHENLRINEIAYLVGFKNPRYFTRTFQKYVEMTPSEYRESVGFIP